jgi:hypothetical protein
MAQLQVRVWLIEFGVPVEDIRLTGTDMYISNLSPRPRRIHFTLSPDGGPQTPRTPSEEGDSAGPDAPATAEIDR